MKTISRELKEEILEAFNNSGCKFGKFTSQASTETTEIVNMTEIDNGLVLINIVTKVIERGIDGSCYESVRVRLVTYDKEHKNLLYNNTPYLRRME